MVTLYGIKNCDTVNKARTWLEQHGIAYQFHDLRIDGIDAVRLMDWVKTAGWETLLNMRGTTWRQLPESDRQRVNATHAIALMLAHPTLIKRPVLEVDDSVTVGFSASTYAGLFSRS